MAQYGGQNQYNQYNPSSNPYNQRAGNPYAQQQQYGGNPYAQQGPAQGRYQDQGNDIEMGRMNGYGAQEQPARTDPMATLNECTDVRNGIAQLDQILERIKYLQQQSLNDPDASLNTRTKRDLEVQLTDASALRNNLTNRVSRLKGKNDFEQYRSQIMSVEKSMREMLQKFVNAEADYQHKLKDQVARQIRIVDPTATEEEIQRQAENPASVRTFADRLEQSDRRGQSTSTLNAVKARAAELERVARQFEELQRSFQQLNEIVVEQGEKAQMIEENTTKVVEDATHANVQLDQGITHAKNRNRNKRWCLLIAIIIVLIIVAAIVAWYFTAGPGGQKKQGN